MISQFMAIVFWGFFVVVYFVLFFVQFFFLKSYENPTNIFKRNSPTFISKFEFQDCERTYHGINECLLYEESPWRLSDACSVSVPLDFKLKANVDLHRHRQSRTLNLCHRGHHLATSYVDNICRNIKLSIISLRQIAQFLELEQKVPVSFFLNSCHSDICFVRVSISMSVNLQHLKTPSNHIQPIFYPNFLEQFFE